MRDVQPRRQPRAQPAAVRCRNFNEVTQGYTPVEALAEAQRCVLCKNARCQAACPLQNHIPQWIAELQQGRIEEAYRIIREVSPMPELCSRLCPQERLCEGACALGIKHEAVAIGPLERFVCDQAKPPPPSTSRSLDSPTRFASQSEACGVARDSAPRAYRKKVPRASRGAPQTAVAAGQAKRRVAAVGSGPASLALAQSLARAGHQVTVFERWPRLGGVLRWIPRFKLPAEILEAHLDMLKRLGVTFYADTEVRRVEQLLTDEGFDAVFVGIGASRPLAPDLPGISLGGILSSTEFLVRVFYDQAELPNAWEPITDLIGQRVAVLGGGDSAMDCVRSAIRLGASSVTCVYRRDEANMPGSKKEVKAATEEGAAFLLLASPTGFRSQNGQTVSHVECVRMELGPPDASGRRSPTPIAGSAFAVEADLVVLAFGYEVESVFDHEHRDLMAPPRGTVKADPATGATPLAGVFAGGDCVTGPELVCTAARSGLVAAQGMLRYFAGEPWEVLAG